MLTVTLQLANVRLSDVNGNVTSYLTLDCSILTVMLQLVNVRLLDVNGNVTVS